MSHTPMVSVIMPVYNAHLYVESTIKSVLNQTYRDFELVIVDDGATDGSGEICDAYAKQDARIVMIHQKNGGICKARNTALQVAKGKYIAFCDHDDLYQPEYLELAVTAAEKADAELVKFSYRSEYSHSGVVTRNTDECVPEQVIRVEELVQNDYELLNKTVRVLWNGLYRHSLIESLHVRFDESIRAGMEDFTFNIQLLQKIEKIVFIPQILFIHYSRLEQSTSEKYHEGRLTDIVNVFAAESKWLAKYSVSSKIVVQHRSMYASLMTRTLCHADCPLTVSEKNAWLKRLKAADELPSKGVLKEAMKELPQKPKIAIQDILFALDWNTLLLSIWCIHTQRKNARKK